MDVKTMTREFINSKSKQVLPDPDPNMTPDKVREYYSNQYPELINCSVTGPEVLKSKLKFTFNATVGTKG